MRKLAEHERGLVLVTGPTGSGKTTTLGSMIDYINETQHKHIVTIEDPIEILHPDKASIVNQREVGTDTSDFHAALKRVLRQDPDVILVGEMRDIETVKTALTAAETGHLVFSTLHTISATDSINRIIDFFAPHEQRQVRMSLAGSLRGIVSQRLVERRNGGRIPAVEILVATGRIFDKIVNADETHEIEQIISEGEYYGMQTFDQSLLSIYGEGLIDLREALAASTSPHDLRLMIEQFTMQRASEQADRQLSAELAVFEGRNAHSRAGTRSRVTMRRECCPAAPGAVLRARRRRRSSSSRRLADAGHRAYLVGGSVRDAFLDRARPDSDIDITTDARPDAIERRAQGLGRRGVAAG